MINVVWIPPASEICSLVFVSSQSQLHWGIPSPKLIRISPLMTSRQPSQPTENSIGNRREIRMSAASPFHSPSGICKSCLLSTSYTINLVTNSTGRWVWVRGAACFVQPILDLCKLKGSVGRRYQRTIQYARNMSSRVFNRQSFATPPRPRSLVWR